MSPLALAGMATKVGMGVGAGQMISGVIKSARADRMSPTEVDPRQVSNLEDIRSRVKAAATGSDAITQNAIRQANQMTKSTQRMIGRSASGNVGSLMSGLLRAQRVGGQNVNNAMAHSRKMLPQFMQLESQLNNQIAKRQLELQMREQNQERAEGAQLQKSGFGNLVGGLAISQSLDSEPERTEGQFGGVKPMQSLEPKLIDQSVTTEGMTPVGM